MSVNDEADRLRLQIEIGACGAFVAVPRNHAEIVLAHANRESPKSAALPFPQGSHSLGRLEPVSGMPKRKLENGEQRPAPQSHQSRAESPEFADQRLERASLTQLSQLA